jgi:putative AdoMet-dependent methyltransferase
MNNLPAWHYDEIQHTGADFSDPKIVKAYDDRMQRLRNIPQEIEIAQNALQLTPDQTLIEIGVGTGEFAIALSSYCKEVIATDISPSMLQYAREKAASRNRTNIRFVQAGFLTYEHAGEPVDAVISQLALHHLPDFWKTIALNRIYSMLKKGGRFFLRDIVFPSNRENYGPFFDQFIEHVRQTAGDDMAMGTANHIKKEYSTLDWIMEGMIYRAGFSIAQKNHPDGYVMATYLCVK